MGLSVCFIAFAVTGAPAPVVYMLPNCDPKNTGNMQCAIEGSTYGRHWAACYDTKTRALLYAGPAYRGTDT